MKEFYELYWNRDTDVSDNDVTTSKRKNRLIEALEEYSTPGAKVLDLGCGGGQFTASVQESGYDVVGMDLSANAVDMARRNHPGILYEILNSDGSIPSEDGVYSGVWTTEVIEHVLDVNCFLSEINRVLKPNGLLILTTPYHGILKNLLIVLFKFARHFDPSGSHIRFFDKKGLTRCLNNCGFEPISWRGIGRFWKMYRTWFVVARKSQG